VADRSGRTGRAARAQELDYATGFTRRATRPSARHTRQDLRGGAVVLKVHNEGPPIPSDLRPLLFDAFSRGDTSPHGLGLGLFIVKQIAVGNRNRVTLLRLAPVAVRATLRTEETARAALRQRATCMSVQAVRGRALTADVVRKSKSFKRNVIIRSGSSASGKACVSIALQTRDRHSPPCPACYTCAHEAAGASAHEDPPAKLAHRDRSALRGEADRGTPGHPGAPERGGAASGDTVAAGNHTAEQRTRDHSCAAALHVRCGPGFAPARQRFPASDAPGYSPAAARSQDRRGVTGGGSRGVTSARETAGAGRRVMASPGSFRTRCSTPRTASCGLSPARYCGSNSRGGRS
jgi:hypothetical protein